MSNKGVKDNAADDNEKKWNYKYQVMNRNANKRNKEKKCHTQNSTK